MRKVILQNSANPPGADHKVRVCECSHLTVANFVMTSARFQLAGAQGLALAAVLGLVRASSAGSERGKCLKAHADSSLRHPPLLGLRTELPLDSQA